MSRPNPCEFVSQALMTSLTFQDDTPLVSAAMSAILALLPVLGNPGTKEFHERVEKVIDDGVITGLGFARSGNQGTVDCLFSAIPDLVRMQGILAVRYLKPLVDLCCEVLRAEYLPLKSQVGACRGVEALVVVCREVWVYFCDGLGRAR